MMQIKEKNVHYFAESETGVFHISNHKNWMCGKGSIKMKTGEILHEVDKSEVCKNCLKHTDAWEPVVGQHDPDKFKVGDRVKIVRGVKGYSNGWTSSWVIEMDAFISKECVIDKAGHHGGYILIDAGGYYFPSQALELVEEVTTDNTETLKNALAEIRSLEMDKNCLRDKVKVRDRFIENQENEKNLALAENESLQQQLEAKTKEFADCCKDLDTRIQGAKVEAEKWRVEFVRVGAERDKSTKELNQLRAATAGHSVKNLCEIMKAAPPAEALTRVNLEFRIIESGEPYWDYSCSCFGKWESPSPSTTKYLTFTPIVEWIENDDITDEMVVAAGGRVPCEVRDHNTTRRIDGVLLMVKPENRCRFICDSDHYKYCRVKKSDLEQS